MSKPKPANIPTPRTPDICSDFKGNMGDPVQWQRLPASCVVSQSGANNPFPFTPCIQVNGLYQISLPSPSTITIASGLTVGTTYSYVVSCCPQNQATHTVKVEG